MGSTRFLVNICRQDWNTGQPDWFVVGFGQPVNSEIMAAE